MAGKPITRALLLSNIGVFVCLWAAPVWAQAPGGTTADPVTPTGGLAEIVVTAQKRAQNLQNVPIAVTALAGTDLASSNIEGQLTLPKLTPNMNFTVIASFASVYIRGVGTQYANPGLESSVSVYVDDTYIPRANSGMFTFNDIERIEVLKGPQGTLYGRNATGGAIRIITHDPKPEFEGSAALTYGTDNRVAVEGMINIPVREGIALRFAARHDEADGYTRNLVPFARQPELGDRNEELYTGKLLLEPTEDLTIKFSGDYARKNDSEGHMFTNLFPGGPEQLGMAIGGCGGLATSFYTLCNDGGRPGVPRLIGQNIESYGGTGRIDYDFGPATASSITAYRVTKENNVADLDSTGANIQNGANKLFTRQFTQELQVASNDTGPLTYVGGVYYLRETSGSFFTVYGEGLDQSLGFPGASLGGDGRQRAESIAPYVQLDWKATDRLTVTAGARYTWESKKLLSNFVVAGPVGPDGFPIESLSSRTQVPDAKRKFNEFTPKLTLSYELADRMMVYATYARGFKSGGLNLPAFGPVDSVDSESLDDFEVGWKMDVGNIRFNGSAFWYKYKDLQIQITDQTTGGTRVVNAAKADIKGLEADITWVPTDQFEFGAGGGYLDHKYKDFIGDAYIPCGEVPGISAGTPAEVDGKAAAQAACAGQGGLGLALVGGRTLSGNSLVNAPKFSGYVRGQYTQPLGEMGQIRLSSIVNYRTKAYFDVANRFVDKKRALVSANITWTSADERYLISVYGENLTGKKYSLINQPQATGGWHVQAPPRQIYVKAGVYF